MQPSIPSAFYFLFANVVPPEVIIVVIFHYDRLRSLARARQEFVEPTNMRLSSPHLLPECCEPVRDQVTR